MIATAFAPGSVGNVGPGFDVLGLAVGGIGDRVTVELTAGPPSVREITGRDAGLVPRDPARNTASIAAAAWLRAHGDSRNAIVSVDKGLPLSGGLGGSASSSVAGAFAACLAAGREPDAIAIVAAALEGEATVAGRHLDNIAAAVFGGLTISRSVDPIDVVAVTVGAEWWVALVTPAIRIETRASRAILPMECNRALWVQQMANTAALAQAFAAGDAALLSRALDDRYAEPLRASLIPRFPEAKRAALEAGAFGCSISGSGPTVFAICEDSAAAERCAGAMQEAFTPTQSAIHVGPISRNGAHRDEPARGPGG